MSMPLGDPDAREALFRYLGLRGNPEFRATDADLKDEQLRLATDNAIKFVREAERLARERGDDVVDAQRS
jgi:hypothetical protein